jgi:hypothetical protein
LGGSGRGLKNSSIDIIDEMDQVLALFELPSYFHEVSGQKALVESLADGNKLPQGLDFLLLKADGREGWAFPFQRESPLGIIQCIRDVIKGAKSILFWPIPPALRRGSFHILFIGQRAWLL